MSGVRNVKHILIVEDSPSNAMVYRSYLEQEYYITIVENGMDALAFLAENSVALILLDVQLPDISGLEVLDKLVQDGLQTPVIVMTAHGNVDVAVEAMRIGAQDFLNKPFDKARLLVTVKNCLKGLELEERIQQIEKTSRRDGLQRMIGASLPMQAVYNIIESAAQSKATVFITGESGTGKELCAEAIHQLSQRKNQTFIAINCAAIPRDLLESEIFGHVKGAFTGAVSAREGAASRAHNGTLFLDEIGEMPMDLQSKILRFIQSGTFQPVGSNKEIQVDVRFICATNRDPLQEVREGRFREDLYYRLHVIPIEMPALREREQDTLLIAESMLGEFTKDEGKSFQRFDDEVEALFLDYPWPGNVRELGNVVRNIVVLNDAEVVSLAMLPAPLNSHQVGQQAKVQVVQRHSEPQPLHHATAREPETLPVAAMPSSEQAIEPLWLQEKRIIEQAIEVCGGNVPRAAAFLEISASTIYRKKVQWDKRLETV